MAEVKGRTVRFRGKPLFTVVPSKIFVYVFLTALAVFMAVPLVYIVVTALKPIDELFIYPPRFFVRRPTLENFSSLFSAMDSSVVPFSRYIFNSAFTTVFVVGGTVIVSSMGAYGLVKHRPPGSAVLFTIIIMALTFGGHVTQIPNYLVVKQLGMINTYWALIIPKIGVAYNMFLMKQFVEGLPDALIEAARLDGANEWTIYTRIIMPFTRPAWATLIVFTFVANWNDSFSSMVFTTIDSMRSLPLAISTLAGGPGAASIATAGLTAASSFLMIAPNIIIFTIMQARVNETMAHAGIK